MGMRKPFSPEVQAQVVHASRRRCALCFGLKGDTTEKRGQIAHIDDPADARLENAAWLCTKHHDKYDSTSRQTKGYMIAELRRHQSDLVQYMSHPGVWTNAAPSTGKQRGAGVSLEVFERRVPTYRATIDFLRYVCQINDLELKVLFKFAGDTDEAVFLFDDALANYLSLLFTKAMHLRAVSLTLASPERYTPELVNTQSELSLWFTEQFEETRKRFAPFLRLSQAG